MITFFIAIASLVLGYFVYGRIVERIFAPDDRETPAITHHDGVDFMVLPGWKIFMIQFLNIAGTGPIFGAIMGAKFGPSAYLWIVLGCIFAGATHDYLSGMLSVRHGGVGLPAIIGKYLGRVPRDIMLVFSIFLLVMVGAVFVYSPAVILSGMWGDATMWIILIFVYYLIATLLPVDKIIGKIYPLFAFSLLFMAAALLIVLCVKMPALPELWDGAGSRLDTGSPTDSIYPFLFITIACGAISGFHATQSPLMARCMKSERQGRPIFYGAMITEGLVALIWATVGMYFFYCEPTPGHEVMGADPEILGKAPKIVDFVCNSWLGTVGAILALLGVVAAPITSGDTALRSARLIVADFLGFEQKRISKRLLICIPLFAVTIGFLFWQIGSPDGFNVIWQYFGWANQTLSVFTLWAITVYLAREHKPFIITFIPAIFMTGVCSVFLIESPMALALPYEYGDRVAWFLFAVCIVWFGLWYRNLRRKERNLQDSDRVFGINVRSKNITKKH